MTVPSHSAKSDFNPEEFPMLQDFLPAYLHEDFSDEYGSAAEAAKNFCADADSDQVREVSAEWRTLRKSFSGRPLAELHAALRQLGAAWQPENDKELQQVDNIFA